MSRGMRIAVRCDKQHRPRRENPCVVLSRFRISVVWHQLSLLRYGISRLNWPSPGALRRRKPSSRSSAGTRQLAIARYGPEHNITPAQKVGASAVAGAASVVPVGLLLRGPRSILPGAVVFSLLGAGGQLVSNRWSGSETSPKTNGWFTSKWSPMTKLSDEQYKAILEERILRLEADLAILDENRAALIEEDDESRAKARKNSSDLA